MRTALPGWGVESRSRTASGTTSSAVEAEKGRFQGLRPRLRRRRRRARRVGRNGLAAEADRGRDGGQADGLVRALRRHSRTKGRAALSPRRPSISTIAARTSGAEASALSIQSDGRGTRHRALVAKLQGGAPDGTDRAVDGAEKVGQRLVLEDRDDEGQRFRRDRALFGTAVRLEDRPGHRQALARLAGLREPAGIEEEEGGGFGPFGSRRGHADLRENGARGRVADVGQGEAGGAAEPLIGGFGQDHELLQGFAAAHLAQMRR